MLRGLIVTAAVCVIGIGAAPAAPAHTHTRFGPIPVSPTSEQNAVRKAQQYLGFSAFSRLGLIEQLVYDGFSEADAMYAVDSITVDWNQQAAKKAEQYMQFSAFSEQGLLEQLEYDGFTPSQAALGVAAAYH